jgi:hypothetical protein
MARNRSRRQRRGGGGRFLVAGAVAAVLLPTMVVVLHAPLWISVFGAAAAFWGLLLVLGPGRPADDLDVSKFGAGQAAVVRAAFNDAMASLAVLESSGSRIRDSGVRSRLRTIAETGRGILLDLQESPANLSSVQRLLTYYLPRAAELAQGYAELERRGLSPQRRASIADLLVKLQGAFSHFRDQLADQDLRGLDVDIKLVGQAIEEDIGPMPVPTPRETETSRRRGR